MVPSLGPFFVLAIERRGCSTTLSVPSSFYPPTRRQRLHEWLKKEGWTLRGGASQVTGGLPTSEEAAHAAEMLFVRDTLGPLRLRPGAVPEKLVARLLSVGVMALHKRCESLFGQRWADFLLARWPGASPSPAPSAATPSAPAPSASAPSAPAAAFVLPMVDPAPAAAIQFSSPAAAPKEVALAPLPPLLPTVSEAAEEMGQEDSTNSLVAYLLNCHAGASCCNEGLESYYFSSGAGGGMVVGSYDLAAAAEAEAADWEAAVPPTPTSHPLPALSAAAAAPQLFVPVPAPAAALAPRAPAPAPALRAAMQPQQSYFATAAAAAAASWVPFLDLSADVPEAPPSFCPDLMASIELDDAELAPAGADLDELTWCNDMWDLFSPPSPVSRL